jgi:hypothetical protein
MDIGARQSIERLKGAVHPWMKRTVKRIFAFLAADDMASFIRQNAVTAAIGKIFPAAAITAAYRDDAPFKRMVLNCNPYIELEMRYAPEQPFSVLLDWFDIGGDAPVRCPDPGWSERKLQSPDLLLTPGLLNADVARLSYLIETRPGFRLAEERQAALLGALEDKGLCRDRWYACLHGEGDAFSALARHIRGRGGQVVRLAGGASEKDISVSGERDGYDLLAAAVSRGRYCLGVDEGLAALASAFLVPSAWVGADGFRGSPWNREDIVFRGGELSYGDLKAIAGHLAGRTAGCSAWRSPDGGIDAETGAGKPRPLTFPLPLADAPVVTFWE